MEKLMTEPASIRYKNPGAMWGSALARKWGAAPKAVTLNDGKGQGNNIAVFPTYVQGICAQLDLWRTSPNYRNKRFADAIAIWSGHNEVESYIAFVLKRVPGMTRNTIMNDAFWKSPMGIQFLKAQAWHEAGKPYPAPDADWVEAQRRVFNLQPEKKPAVTKEDTGKAVVVATTSGTVAAGIQQGWGLMEWCIAGAAVLAFATLVYFVWRWWKARETKPLVFTDPSLVPVEARPTAAASLPSAEEVWKPQPKPRKTAAKAKPSAKRKTAKKRKAA